MIQGVVESWLDEEGWGVLTSPALAEPVWAHFCHIVDMPGFRTLTAGNAVEFDYEDADQDGYIYRATSVRLLR
ncbi:Cupin 2, conserved barrel domain protein [Alloactinosynnema sp. L-07]|nr:Cupin 2, conserved barrel domain protein [Alloactinosynnema sp. L-07]